MNQNSIYITGVGGGHGPDEGHDSVAVLSPAHLRQFCLSSTVVRPDEDQTDQQFSRIAGTARWNPCRSKRNRCSSPKMNRDLFEDG